MAEERKLVTILFADVVGSTALAVDNDPEVVRGVMARYFKRLAEIAETHGGTVEKYAGDAVMVVFGVPQVHDDDAERAVRAALESRDAVAEMNSQLPILLAVRVGVTSGEAVTGAREDRQFMVSGDPVNVAARLQQGAEPGEVVVGALTEALTRAVIEYEKRPSITAKGKPEPLLAFRAIKPRNAIPTQARGVGGLKSRLVGRDLELRLLVDTFARVVEDRRPHLFTLLGGGGVGKSRLVAEALADPAFAGARVLRGRCLPYGRGITYWPLVEIFGRVVPERAGSDSEWPAVRARLAVLLGLETPAVAMHDVAPENVGREIAWAVRRHFQAVAASTPLVLVIDDLQWAEEPLADLVHQLSERMADVPLLLLAIARPELLERFPRWGGGKASATTLTLNPLGPAETADLISSLLDLDALPAALRERIVERSEGTPLYCEEFLRMLIDEGRLVRVDGAWRATSPSAEVPVPHTIQALLAARLDGLEAAEKSFLQAASVIGEQLRASEVATLLGAPAGGAALDGLLVKAMLVEGDTPNELRFRHLLIRDAAYSSMPKLRRAELHEAYAGHLEALPHAAEQLVEIISHHAERAHSLSRDLLLPAEVLEPRARRALRWAVALFDRALSRREVGAMDAAQGIARHAAESLPGGGDAPVQAVLVMQTVQRAIAIADYSAVHEHLEQAARLARAAGRNDLLAEALLAEMVVYSQAGGGGLAHLETLLEPTVAAFREAGDEKGELEARFIASLRMWSEGDLERFVTELMELSRRSAEMGAEALSAGMLVRVASAEFFQGALDSALAHFEQAETIAARLGLTEVLGRVRLGLGSVALMEGRATDAEGHYRQLLEFAADSAAARVTSHRFTGYALDHQGRFEEAAAELDLAIRISEESGDRWNRSELYSLRARLALELEGVVGAEGFLASASRYLLEGDVTSDAELCQATARIRGAQGLPGEAEAAYRRGLSAVGKTEFNWPRTILELELADLLCSSGRLDEARSLLESRASWLAAAGWHLWDGDIARLRARLQR